MEGNESGCFRQRGVVREPFTDTVINLRSFLGKGIFTISNTLCISTLCTMLLTSDYFPLTHTEAVACALLISCEHKVAHMMSSFDTPVKLDRYLEKL